MQLRIKGKVIYSYSWKRLLYALCFCMFCVIDQRIKTGTGLDGWIETFRDLTGVVMAVIIMSGYKWEDFRKRKLPYIMWSVMSFVGGGVALIWGMSNRPFLNAWIVVIVDVILYGYILIHTFISVVIEKKYPKLNKKFALVWLVMMILMLCSRSDYIWPFCYLVMFGCFYLTNYAREDREALSQGMLDGIILAFFLMQGWCFVFRPFDNSGCRYVGVYSNSNLNALFYLVVLMAVFSKIIYVNRINAGKWIKLYYWLGAGVVMAFLFMTIGRTAWLTAFAIGLVFLACLKLVQKKKRFVLNGLILILCTCLMFPLCFTAVRYFPPMFHHPVWFWGEWSEENVHSWDPVDSPKYVDFDEFMDAAVGRVFESVGQIFAHSPMTMKTYAAEMDDRAEKAVLTNEESKDGFLVRKTIYQHYASELNLWGHPYEEQGFQLGPYYWIGHAHNIYLQYGTDFGIIVMLLFMALIVWSIVLLTGRIVKQCSEVEVGRLLFILVPSVFGILEYSWGVGSITILLLFVAWGKVVCNEEG